MNLSSPFASKHFPGITSTSNSRMELKRALVSILTGEIIAGSLPLGARSLVKQWADLHREELIEDWNLASTLQPLKRIEPLP